MDSSIAETKKVKDSKGPQDAIESNVGEIPQATGMGSSQNIFNEVASAANAHRNTYQSPGSNPRSSWTNKMPMKNKPLVIPRNRSEPSISKIDRFSTDNKLTLGQEIRKNSSPIASTSALRKNSTLTSCTKNFGTSKIPILKSRLNKVSSSRKLATPESISLPLMKSNVSESFQCSNIADLKAYSIHEIQMTVSTENKPSEHSLENKTSDGTLSFISCGSESLKNEFEDEDILPESLHPDADQYVIDEAENSDDSENSDSDIIVDYYQSGFNSQSTHPSSETEEPDLDTSSEGIFDVSNDSTSMSDSDDSEMLIDDDGNQLNVDIRAHLSPNAASRRIRDKALKLLIPYLDAQDLKVARGVCPMWCQKISNSKWFWKKFSFRKQVKNVDWKYYWRSNSFCCNYKCRSFTWVNLSNPTNFKHLYDNRLLIKYLKLQNCSFTVVFLQWIFTYCTNLKHLIIDGFDFELLTGLQMCEAVYAPSYPKANRLTLSTLIMKLTDEQYKAKGEGLDLSEGFLADIFNGSNALNIIKFIGFSCKTYSNIAIILTEKFQNMPLKEIYFQNIRTDSRINLMDLLPIFYMPYALMKFSLTFDKSLNFKQSQHWKSKYSHFGKGAVNFLNKQSCGLLYLDLNYLPISEEIFNVANSIPTLRAFSAFGTNIKDEAFLTAKFPYLKLYIGPNFLTDARNSSDSNNMSATNYGISQGEMVAYGFIVFFGFIFAYFYSCYDSSTGLRKSSCDFRQPEALIMGFLMLMIGIVAKLHCENKETLLSMENETDPTE